ncbi:MAG: DUF4386 domain-containing protein [Caldilineaceae bacterium]
MTHTAQRRLARMAGLLYLIIFAGGIFAQFVVRQSLIVPHDAMTTANNILASEAFFRLGIGGDLLMLLSDVALAVLFFVLLRPVNKTLSMMAAVFRLSQAAVIGSSLVNLFYALNLLHSTELMTAVGAAQLMLFLNAHAIGYSVAMIFFGVNCLLTGYLVFQSGYFPKILGILLVIAGVAYLTDSFAQVLLTDYAAYKALFESVAIPLAVIGEFAMCLWLLIKGVKVAPQDAAIGLVTAQAKGAGA